MIPSAPPIRSLFSASKPIDRPIEKVIDYNHTEANKLQAEIEEYEVTESLERNFRRFLDHFGHGLRTGQAAETGIWVSGFYGSGKSSFTKYLGLALDPERKVGGRPFLDLLGDRINAADVRQEMKTLAAQEPVAVVMLDLATEQLASSSTAPVSTVLYWKVLQGAGYSKVPKVAHLELRLETDGKLEEFRQEYARRGFGDTWKQVHDDPLTAVTRAAQIVPSFYPKDFPDPTAFRTLQFDLADTVRDLAGRMISVIRRDSDRRNILILIDEAGQYVAPRGELILNLDGLARSLKELGQGRVWLVCTAQQTLTEITEKAQYNSAELIKLRDRFPISLELDAKDIREVTHRRLLTKSPQGTQAVAALFQKHGSSLVTNTRLAGTALYKGDPDQQDFVRLYPLLPHHFDLLLEMTRKLARGATAVRSAIRVVQDLLVDTSKVLPPGTTLLADAPLGSLATMDQFFDTLRNDISKILPYAVSGVERAGRVLPGDLLALRVAKAIAALQVIEGFPRTPENLAALLYAEVGAPPNLQSVRDALRRLVDQKEIGLVDDPQAGGFTFLSEAVKPLRDKRDGYPPTRGEMDTLRKRILTGLFDPIPSVSLHAAKTIRAGIALGALSVAGLGEDIQIHLEVTDGGGWDQRRQTLLTETTGNAEWKAAIAWLVKPDDALDDFLVQIVRSQKILEGTDERKVDQEVAQFLRAERRSIEVNEGQAKVLYNKALIDGTLIFRGKPIPAQTAGLTIHAAAQAVLADAAEQVFPNFRLVPLRASTDLAAKFLGVERLDKMPKDVDPLGLVKVSSGRARVDVQHAALTEALKAFKDRLNKDGTSRITGLAVQDMFAAPPYGWSKDATRYVFAALLVAGEVVVHVAGGEVKTSGPTAIEAFRTTQSFGRVGLSVRGSKPKNDELDRAASRLEALLGGTVMPLEDKIGQAARQGLPARVSRVTSLPLQLGLLGLAGVDRAQAVNEQGEAVLREDGAGAIGVLGAATCTFPEDLRWAEGLAQALSDGGERDVKAARSVLEGLDRLTQLYPSTRKEVGAGDVATIADILRSEELATRLADLRGAVQRVQGQLRAGYAQELASHTSDLQAVQQRLEGLPEWLQVSDEDRAELAGRLKQGLPATPPDGEEGTHLGLALTRRNSLMGLERDLREELVRRVPTTVSGATPEETVLDMTSLLPSGTLKDIDDLTKWLDSLRARLEEALASKKPLRLRIKI